MPFRSAIWSAPITKESVYMAATFEALAVASLSAATAGVSRASVDSSISGDSH